MHEVVSFAMDSHGADVLAFNTILLLCVSDLGMDLECHPINFLAGNHSYLGYVLVSKQRFPGVASQCG